jgi:hypothetical protein
MQLPYTQVGPQVSVPSPQGCSEPEQLAQGRVWPSLQTLHTPATQAQLALQVSVSLPVPQELQPLTT